MVMTINQLLVLGATKENDHVVIRRACKICSVPFTRVGKSLYIIDMCTAKPDNIDELLVDIGDIQPLNLKMLKGI